MDAFTIDYIIKHYGRFMTKEEAMAWIHYNTIRKLRESSEIDNKPDKHLVDIGWASDDDTILALLKDGWLTFRERTAARIVKDNREKIFFNNCPRCGKLARTTVAKQCRSCGFSWHHVVSATFRAEGSFAITGRGCCIMGDIVSGRIKVGMKLDLVPLGIPKQVVISDVGMGRRGEGKFDFVGLTLIGLTDEEIQFLKSKAPFSQIINIEH